MIVLRPQPGVSATTLSEPVGQADRHTHRELAELTATVEELPVIAWD